MVQQFFGSHRRGWGIAVLITAVAAGGVAAGLFLAQPRSTPLPAPIVEGYSAGAYRVQVAVSPDPPQPGKNQLTLNLRDAAGQPVAQAQLTARADMPAMGAMPTMRAPAELHEAAPGEFRGELDLPMEGPWPLTVEISGPAGAARLVLDMSTERKGLRADTPGAPSMNMGEHETESIHIDARRRQLIGVTTSPVRRTAVNYTVRASGKIAGDERRLADIALKYNGWIGELHANYMGARVRKGEPLFTVFSPALLNAQHEYLNAYKHRAEGGGAAELLSGARQRLMLWDVRPAQIAALEQSGEASQYLPVVAPVDGVVVEKNVVAGSAFNAGDKLLRIADLARVWVEAQAYQFELPMLATGVDAEVRLADAPQKVLHGKVSFVAPQFDGATRTARLRVELNNADGALRPDMYAEVSLRVDLGKRLVVPDEAVLYSGANRVVFLDLGDGRLLPRKIKTGLRNGGWIEVLEGLKEGDTIVTSGNFLIASESKLKGGLEQW